MSSFFVVSSSPMPQCCYHIFDLVTSCIVTHEPIYSHGPILFATACASMVSFTILLSNIYNCIIYYLYNCIQMIQWLYCTRNFQYTFLFYTLLSMIYIIECATVIDGTWNDDYIHSSTAHGGWLVSDDALPPNTIDIVTQGTVSMYHGPFNGDSHSGTIDEYSLTQYFECAVRSALHIEYTYSHCGSTNRDYLKLFMDDIEQISTEKVKSDICLDDDLLESVSTFCGKSSSCKTVGPWTKIDIGPLVLPVVEPSQPFKIQFIIGTNNDADGTAISQLIMHCVPDATTSIPTTNKPTISTTKEALTTSNPTTARPTTYNTTTQNPTTTKPTTTSVNTIEPTSSIAATMNPTTTSRPTTVNPTNSFPNTMNPTTSMPYTTIPTSSTTSYSITTSNPTSVVASTSNPSETKQTTNNPITTERNTMNPTTSHPTTVTPTTSDPTTIRATTMNPTIVTTSYSSTNQKTTTAAASTLNPTEATQTTANPITSDSTTSNPTTFTPTTYNSTTSHSVTNQKTTSVIATTLNPTEPKQTTDNPMTTKYSTTINTTSRSSTTFVSTTMNPTPQAITTSGVTTITPTTLHPITISSTTTSNTVITIAPVTIPPDIESDEDNDERSQLKLSSDFDIESEEECAFVCWQCLQQIDVIGNDISWNLTFIAQNQSNCSCPQTQASKQNNLTLSIGAQDVDQIRTLPEYQLKLEKYALNDEDEYGLRLSVFYWMHRPQNCILSYFVNENEFFGVQAHNVLSITFTICGLSEDQLTDEALEISRNEYIDSVAYLFNVSENDVNVVINIGSFCDDPSNRRRLLSTDRDQEVTIAIIFADASDAEAAQQGACDAVRLDHPQINGECYVKLQSENEILDEINDEPDINISSASDKLDAVQITMIVIGAVALCLFTIFILYYYASRQKKQVKKILEVKFDAVPSKSPDCARDIVTSNGHERITSHAMAVNPLHKANISVKTLPSAFVHEMQMMGGHNMKAKHEMLPSNTYSWSQAPRYSNSMTPNNNIQINMEEDIQIHVRTSTTITHVSMDSGALYSALPVLDNETLNNVALSVIDDKLYATPLDMIQQVVEKKKANEIVIDDITMGDKIGKGRFGTVYKAIWEGNTVVVKQLNSDPNADKNDARLKEMKAEIILASSLPTHHNLVEIFGFISSPFGVVMHYMEGGSVQEYVYRAYNKDTKTSIIELLYILEKAAAGVKFLHSYNLVHRDIACRNILLGKIDKNRIEASTQVRISDFGLTRKLDSDNNEQETQSNFGPLKWMAPESIKQKMYSKQSDVYMFGITMWEIFYGMEPYTNMNAANVAINVVSKHQRPQITDCLHMNQNVVMPSIQMHDGYKKLMEECWAQDAKQRPSFTEITHRLSIILEQHPTQYWE